MHEGILTRALIFFSPEKGNGYSLLTPGIIRCTGAVPAKLQEVKDSWLADKGQNLVSSSVGPEGGREKPMMVLSERPVTSAGDDERGQ